MSKSKTVTIHVPIEVKGFDEFKEKVDQLAELIEEASFIIVDQLAELIEEASFIIDDFTSNGVELEIEVCRPIGEIQTTGGA